MLTVDSDTSLATKSMRLSHLTDWSTNVYKMQFNLLNILFFPHHHQHQSALPFSSNQLLISHLP